MNYRLLRIKNSVMPELENASGGIFDRFTIGDGMTPERN